jgi:hypothetical protein
VERRPRVTALAAVSILSRELIALVLLGMVAWALPACGGPGLILKSPLTDKCNEAALKRCPDLTDAVIAYAGGEKEESKKKIAAVVAANEPQRTQQFAEALETIANLPGLGATADTIRELSDFLKGDKPEKTGGASAATGIAAVVGETPLPAGPAAAPAEPAPDHAKIEPEARALQKKAMDEDYLTVAFDKAADELNQAITKCGTNHCAANLRALLRRDLAVVYSAASKRDLALAAMADAFKIDGTIRLDPNFKTKEIEAVYAQARKVRLIASEPAVSSGGGSPSGDFTHTPPVEEATRTPLPIYVEYGGSEALAKVVVKYKAFGMPDFKTFELKKLGDGWGGTLPCTDMLEGDIRYYLQGFNATNDPVATGGDRNNTYKVSIKKAIASEPPHLPGQIAPMQCAEGADCPPDFPGCKKAGADTLLAAGADCAEDGQCKSGTCKDEKCTAPPDEGGGARPPLHRIWLGLSASIDLDILSGANNVCKLTPTTATPVDPGYFCTVGGSDWPPRTPAGATINNQLVSGGPNPGDALNGGPNFGSLRIMASFDYALNYNLMVGARFGYGFLSYPGSAAGFPPIYLEGRLTWVIGKDAIAKSGFAPLLFLGGGAGQFSSSVSVPAALCGQTAATKGATATAAGGCTVGNPTEGNVTAWRVGGPVFVGPGGGIRFAFSPRAAAFLNVKLALAFGGGGILVAPGPELGAQFGF